MAAVKIIMTIFANIFYIGRILIKLVTTINYFEYEDYS